MTQKVCLDLFCGLGGFSAAFEDAGDWDVVTVDIEERFDPDIQADVFDLRPSDFNTEFDVVLASPPCTRLGKMALCNGYFEGDTPATEDAADHVALLHHTVGLIRGISPDYWFLENPPGKVSAFIGVPSGTVTYCQYGEDYMKRTHLWGDHPPMKYNSCTEGDGCHIGTPRSDERHPSDSIPADQAEASKVPYDLSEAIRDAVDAALSGDVREQTGLTDW